MSEPRPQLPFYIQFEPGETKGALHVPPGARAQAAFLICHRTKNFMNHIAARQLSDRGFLVLCINPRSDNNEAAVDFESLALDVRQGVEYLRSQQGIRHVVLIGHSGGGPTMSFYQALAENGPEVFSGPGRLTQCPLSYSGMPRADALILLDAHPGNPVNVLRSLNPAVVDERHPQQLDPALDPFSPANGFNPDGHSVYTEAFMDRYFKAQAARMNRLIGRALAMREDIASPGRVPGDDDVFIAYRASARLSDFSMSTAAGSVGPCKLLRNDGSVEFAPIRSVRPAASGHARRDKTMRGALLRTVTSFLSANAIRATDSMDGIDWHSSNNSVPGALPLISVPLLIAAMQAHYFIRDAEAFYAVAQSRDKDLVVLEGADHFARPCPRAAKATGMDYSNATRNMFDYVATWTRARFA